MDPTELAFAGVARQAELLRSGELSAQELVTVYLERITRLDPAVNAFTAVFADAALSQAAEADREMRNGAELPLLGVPVGIKEDTEIAGVVTSHGSRAHDRPAPQDSAVVRRLRAAGAILIGHTTAPELAIWPFTASQAHGVTRNPWDTSRTPGGSSGGSGAAVAAGLVGAATGSDGMGSIRIPASCCGLVGIKPQRGRVPMAPADDSWQGLSTRGPLARRVVDAALLLDVLSAAPPDASFLQAAHRPPRRLRIAVSMNPPPPLPIRTHPAVRQALGKVVSALHQSEHRVERNEIPYGTSGSHALTRYLRGVHDAVAQVPHPERLEHRARGFARLGGRVPAPLVHAVRQREKHVAAHVHAVFDTFDVVVAPVVLHPAVAADPWPGRSAAATLARAARFTPFPGVWNVLGNPAVAVPAGTDEAGCPIGVQLVGRAGDEATLISLAAELEAILRWPEDRPALCT